MTRQLTRFVEEIHQQSFWHSLRYEADDHYCTFEIPSNNGFFTANVRRVAITLTRYPHLRMDIERCDKDRHRIIVFSRGLGTNYSRSYANTRLDRIKSRGNGILFMVIQDGKVRNVSEVLAEKFNDICLTIEAVEKVLVLGEQEHMRKMMKRAAR
jgi:hypothetical protein